MPGGKKALVDNNNKSEIKIIIKVLGQIWPDTLINLIIKLKNTAQD